MRKTANFPGRDFWKWKTSKLLFVLLAWCGLQGWPGSCLEAQSATEQDLKAAFLYHFAQFVEWPSDAFADDNAPIVVGVLGDDSFRKIVIQTVENKVVQGRRFEVRKWKRNETAQRCQILFIGASENGALAETLQNMNTSGVLTIGETEGFAKRGGMINFVLFENKLRFEINHKSAESAGLKISSKLLKLARAVWE